MPYPAKREDEPCTETEVCDNDEDEVLFLARSPDNLEALLTPALPARGLLSPSPSGISGVERACGPNDNSFTTGAVLSRVVSRLVAVAVAVGIAAADAADCTSRDDEDNTDDDGKEEEEGGVEEGGAAVEVVVVEDAKGDLEEAALPVSGLTATVPLPDALAPEVGSPA